MQDLEENSEKGIENQECFLYNVNVILFVSENVARTPFGPLTFWKGGEPMELLKQRIRQDGTVKGVESLTTLTSSTSSAGFSKLYLIFGFESLNLLPFLRKLERSSSSVSTAAA